MFNISKETTRKEIISITGVDPHTQKMQGINLSGGFTNAVAFCSTMLNFPTLEEMLVLFEKENTV